MDYYKISTKKVHFIFYWYRVSSNFSENILQRKIICSEFWLERLKKIIRSKKILTTRLNSFSKNMDLNGFWLHEKYNAYLYSCLFCMLCRTFLLVCFFILARHLVKFKKLDFVGGVETTDSKLLLQTKAIKII